MGMQISASELLKMFVFDSDPVSTLGRAGVIDQGKAQSPSDQFVDMVLEGLMNARSGEISPAEFRTRMQLISATVTPSLWKIEAQAGERLQRYLREVLASEGSEPPPSRLGSRTFADLLDGRIGDSEFALIIKQHANALFQRLTRLSSMQMAQRTGAMDQNAAVLDDELRQLSMIDIGRLFFYAAQGKDVYPETYPEVATLAGILILKPRVDPEMSDAAMERQASAYANLQRAVGEQLGLAWISRAVLHESGKIFFHEDGNRILDPEVQRLEKVITSAALMGNGIVPSPADFEDRYTWTRACVQLIVRARFDEDTVLRAFGNALKSLPDRFGWAFSLLKEYGDRAQSILGDPPFDALLRSRRYDSIARDHESRGDRSRAAIRSHMAAKELVKVMSQAGPQKQVIAAESKALLLRARQLYNVAINDVKRLAQSGHAPSLWEEQIRALYHRSEEASNDIVSVEYQLRKDNRPSVRPTIEPFAGNEDESPLSVAVANMTQYQSEPQTAPPVDDGDVDEAFSRVMGTEEDAAAGQMPFVPVPGGSLKK